jgi:hypothetical protein
MASPTSMLYEPMLERDVAGIRRVASEMLARDGVTSLYESVARFAVLAFAPTQHCKHALLASLAVHELQASLGSRFADAVVEVAIYLAESRLPWSEPPILDPQPAIDGQPVDLDEIRTAVREGDRLRAERWLAARLDDPALVRDYFTIATDDFDDLGHKLIVSTAAWKLSSLLGERGRYGTLRVAACEWTAYRGEAIETAAFAFDDRARLLEAIVTRMIEEKGSIVAAHQLHLFDAALEAERLGASEDSVARALAASATESSDGGAELSCRTPLPIYPYARDLAGYLEACAIASRIETKFGAAIARRITAAACHNLEHAEGLDAWSFA